ncbi:hypothetical protein EDD22DRAFT_799291 [Suillus occidentalis]|nr:hypothetical protein EDD22DRAFT_799291 [Suillus occidentalis]
MFNKPYCHIPFVAQTPAGFRMLRAPKKKPRVRPSIFSPSPCVDSPSSTPARAPNAPAFFDYNAPPAQALPHFFQPTSANPARASRPTKTTAAAPTVVKKKNASIKVSTSEIIHSRRKLWPKRLNYHLTIARLRRKGPRFHNPAKLKREKAAAALNDLKNVAIETMQVDGMTDEDFIFLKQLQALQVDQRRKHTLGDAREIVARAEELSPIRELEHAERDRQAVLRLEDNARRKKEEEEFRRLEELRRQEEEKRREEEARRRAEEETRLRAQRERELQAKREALRKAQEEAERRAREQAEQRLREEAQRQERLRQEEELRRNKAQADIVAFFQLYDAKWQELRLSKTLTSVMLCEMPWPIFQQGCTSPDDISQRSMEEFIFHPLRPGMELKSRKDRLKVEILRFHPDKFNSNIARKLRECDREMAIEIAGALARMLTHMMGEEIKKEGGQ